MPDDLTFLMGKYEAILPGELRYGRNHMWCCASGGRFRFGFTSYAVRLMQDVYFLDWLISAGDAVQQSQQIGHIETSKAVSDLFAPISGTITAFNTELLDDPSAINVDKYGAGWLFDMEGDVANTMTVAEYHQYLAANWEKTQRLIKGKINEDA
ncbi:MAG TPA: biotin/lipoyl-containing protein [Gemmataceae bacterium]|nr:biotin/lipoyl-containing protein [Gemmataceae bacterium]